MANSRLSLTSLSNIQPLHVGLTFFVLFLPSLPKPCLIYQKLAFSNLFTGYRRSRKPLGPYFVASHIFPFVSLFNNPVSQGLGWIDIPTYFLIQLASSISIEFCELNRLVPSKKMWDWWFGKGFTFTVSYGETRRKWRL